ncbi:NAD(P)-dependent dehydrogenase, short-chain alcohol dehydrogenase family [Halogranum amylolyticum]|uniref:NAD(P)-dependent dehydrogenase, short-chain alcohol dehydrogenase family n=1 Tax=Halogranum amylolyticum TaxID=660520 RepID=A0A1H8RVH7_9EURY|nr:SDR family oxidoreductase [Halogranum amylolyticum]SEO70307.1 NAD(P)-dependent dehydrogenase, short-chain alcohol dehydrogenase family [Halogranum amylolyticum]
MSVSFDYSDRVVLVTGASGALGSAVATTFRDAGATVAASDVVDPSDEDAHLETGEGIQFYQGDFTDESDVEDVVESVVDDHGRLDCLLNIAGTWRGGSPVDETDVDEFDLLFDVNLKTMFLASKHALPHLRETEGAIVSVSARSSLEGGEGDGPYRASKAGVRLLTETVAEENTGTVRANAVMPSVIDTPMNREMMEPKDEWVDPERIARVMLFLCSDAAEVTSGAAVPVYGEA